MKNKKMGSLGILFRFLKIMGKPLPLFLFAMIIHMVGDNLFNVTLSVFVNNVVEMARSGNMEGFWRMLLRCVLAGAAALMIFFVFGAIYDIEAKRGNAKVQKLVIEKALRMPMWYYDKNHSGDIVSKLLNDADVASQIFTSRLRRVTTPIMSVVVYFIPMLIMNYRLALSLFAVNVVSLFINSKYVSPMKAVGIEISGEKRNMTKDISTVAAGIGSIKMYPGCVNLCERFKKDAKEYSDSRIRLIGMSAMLGGINTFFDMTCALGFLFVSIYFVGRNMASLGSVAAVYTLYGSFSYNFLELGKYLPELMNCIARAQILFEYLEAEEEEGIIYQNRDDMDIGIDLTGDYAAEFKNVDFTYNVRGTAENKLYDHLNLQFLRGESTAVVGKTGCGKSTLFKLMLGFYPPLSGEISVFGEKLTYDNCGNIRKSIAYIPQKTHLFRMSFKDNIRLGNPQATDEEVIEAAKAANAHDFIIRQPDGYDTIVENGGSSLSGGEQQRIAIARAFIRKAPLLLMDEATSSLDNENDNLIAEAVKNLKDCTVLIIAHKPSTIQSVQHVLSLNC